MSVKMRLKVYYNSAITFAVSQDCSWGQCGGRKIWYSIFFPLAFDRGYRSCCLFFEALLFYLTLFSTATRSKLLLYMSLTQRWNTETGNIIYLEKVIYTKSLTPLDWDFLSTYLLNQGVMNLTLPLSELPYYIINTKEDWAYDICVIVSQIIM